VAIDLGERRIGVAVSDTRGTLATPRASITRSGDADRDRRAVAEVVVELSARVLVIGLPLSLQGRRGTAARDAETEAEALRNLLRPDGVRVELFDERLTTVSAQTALRDAGRTARDQRSVVDSAAATVLLQAWLEAEPR